MNRKQRREAAAQGRRGGEAAPPPAGSALAALYEEAVALRRAGRLDAALATLERALAREPEQPFVLAELAQVQRLRDEPGRAAQALRRALRAAPRSAELAFNLGHTLRDLGEEEEALRAFERAAQLKPELAQALGDVGLSHHRLGRLEAAIEHYERALERAPDLTRVLTDLAVALLEAGQARRAHEVAGDCLRREPRALAAMMVRAHAADELGETAEAAALLDLERLVRPAAVEAVEGYASVAEFNAALRAHVEAHPSLARQPNQRTTRGGQQTGDLNVEPRGPVAALEALLQQRVRAYLDALGRDPAHPYLAQRPAAFHLNLWATLLDSAGHQAPHIHPAAWVSGVYYLQVPAEVRADDPGQQGWIEFGRAPESFPLQAAPRVRRLQPEEGLLVLFPSYLYHRTIPFESGTRRISVALDALPRA